MDAPVICSRPALRSHAVIRHSPKNDAPLRCVTSHSVLCPATNLVAQKLIAERHDPHVGSNMATTVSKKLEMESILIHLSDQHDRWSKYYSIGTLMLLTIRLIGTSFDIVCALTPGRQRVY